MKKQLKKVENANLVDAQVKEFINRPYARILIPNEDGTYTAEILEFPGCISQGRTPQEAMKNLEDVAKSWVQVSLEGGKTIPFPCNDYRHSGKILLRLPRSLHQQAAKMAMREDCSLNQYLISAISARVGISDLVSRVAERLANKIVRIQATFSISKTTTTIAGHSPQREKGIAQDMAVGGLEVWGRNFSTGGLVSPIAGEAN